MSEPVLGWSALVAFVGGLVTLLVEFGIDISDGQVKAILAVLALAGPVVAAVVARRAVTPLSDPQDNEGRPLRVDAS